MHEMRLHNSPFNLIKSGTKTIELRLNDEKRSLIKVGEVSSKFFDEEEDVVLCNGCSEYYLSFPNDH